VEREQRDRPAVRVRRGEWNSGVPSASEVSTLWRDTHTHTHQFNGPFSGTTRVSRYQKGKTDLDFTEVRGDSEWQWHLLDHMQVCASLKTDNHTSTPPPFLQAGCPSCCPTNSIKAPKTLWRYTDTFVLLSLYRTVDILSVVR